MLSNVKIATRKSNLALWQAVSVQELLTNNGIQVSLYPLVTTGDKLQKSQLSNVQLSNGVLPHLSTGKGLFIKEIQEALLNNEAHIAVHSMKDLPVTQTHDLSVVSVLPRAGKHDVLVLSPKVIDEIKEIDPYFDLQKNININDLKKVLLQSKTFTSLPIGTTSSRRQMLLRKHIANELNICVLRGNVDTRLKRLNNNEFSAIMLAEAGLQRLKLFQVENMLLMPIAQFIPAPAQGIVAIELGLRDKELIQAVIKINNKEAFFEAGLERLVLFLLGGDCHSAVGVCKENDKLYIICERNGVVRESVLSLNANVYSLLQTFYNEAENQYSRFFEKLCHSSFATEVVNHLRENAFADVANL